MFVWSYRPPKEVIKHTAICMMLDFGETCVIKLLVATQ